MEIDTLSKWVIFLCAALLSNQLLSWLSYHLLRRNRSKEQLPPMFPALVPLVGHAIAAAWDLEGFLHRVTYGHRFENDSGLL